MIHVRNQAGGLSRYWLERIPVGDQRDELHREFNDGEHYTVLNNDDAQLWVVKGHDGSVVNAGHARSTHIPKYVAAAVETEWSADQLRDDLSPGDVVHTILRHVTPSGMRRSIEVVIVGDEHPMYLTYHVARVLGERVDERNGGVMVSGAGMDMGFELVYRLSWRLWPQGFQCVGTGCPSNDHRNPPYPKDDGEMWHDEPGYALVQRWL